MRPRSVAVRHHASDGRCRRPAAPLARSVNRPQNSVRRTCVALGGGNARYDFGANRVATLALLTITTLPSRRFCGTARANFSGHAFTFRRSPTVFAETRMSLDLPAPASYLASHRELSGGRQRFWACIAFGHPHSPTSFSPRSWRWRRWPWWSRRWWFGLGGLRRLKY